MTQRNTDQILKMSRYEYSCGNCGGTVQKTPTGVGLGKKAIKAGLHGWSCAACNLKGVKVKRQLSGNCTPDLKTGRRKILR
jgi:hypothetical protein